ncbi:uncharacterized protein [Amphiura filiformis]|uniref:uncharacterized protein n=1 Tax=Amphiura filiformis TaxID=82378 RepID=UPI003B21B7F6
MPDADDEESLKAPSNGLKMAIQVRKLCVIKRARSIKDEDTTGRKEAKQFLELMDAEWDTKLERLLLAERKFRKEDPLPLPSDIEKLSVYLRDRAESADLEDYSYTNYRRNVIVALASCISYNRRRPGDVQALTLQDYQERKSGLDDVAAESFGDDLTQFERHLVLSQDVISIRAKGNKYLPLLVQTHIRPILEYLASDRCRRKAGIMSFNMYLFANNRTGVIRGGFTEGNGGWGKSQPS